MNRPSQFSRREFVQAGAALALWPLSRAFARPRKSRLSLLGTAGGPTPKPNRTAPSQVIVVDDACYVIDCGNGVARRGCSRASHFVPGGYPFVTDEVWHDALRPHFAGNLIVGRDLLEIRASWEERRGASIRSQQKKRR